MREPDSHEQGGSSHLALLLTSKTRVPDHEQHLARVRQQSREGPPLPSLLSPEALCLCTSFPWNL